MDKYLIHIDQGDEIAYVKINDAPGQGDIQRAADAMLHHPQYRDRMDSLWDFRSATLNNLYPEQLAGLAQWLIPHQERLPARLAFIAGSDMDCHVLRMWNFFSDEDHPRQRRTFFELNAGRNWLLSSRDS